MRLYFKTEEIETQAQLNTLINYFNTKTDSKHGARPLEKVKTSPYLIFNTAPTSVGTFSTLTTTKNKEDLKDFKNMSLSAAMRDYLRSLRKQHEEIHKSLDKVATEISVASYVVNKEDRFEDTRVPYKRETV